MNPEHTESDEPPAVQELRMVLIGRSEAGKSSIGNVILGREAFKESRTIESEKQTGRVEDRDISIIDTPGFFNTHLTEEEMKNEMMKSMFLCYPGPHLFLLVINLKTFREEQRNLVEQVQENFGEEALLFTMVLFIGREKVSKRELNQIIESQATQKILNYFEGRCHVINSKSECDSTQIIKLLNNIDKIVNNNGGQHYSNEIYLKNQRKVREEERMKQVENRLKQEEEKMKQEQARRGHMEMKKIQEDSGTWKRKGGINQEEDITMRSKEEGIKDDNERKRENVRKKKTKYLRENGAAVQENLRRQMESRREKERQRWKLERENPSRPDLRIMILGKSDVGKTATANTILCRNAFQAGAQSDTLTCEKQDAVVSGRNISIIDTPGLLDAQMYKHFPDELKRDIDTFLEMSAPGPHVFLLVIRLNGEYTEEEKNTVKWIQKNFGEDAVRHTFVLFTHMDLLKDESLDQYIRKSPDLQPLIDSCGRRFHSFNNQHRNNQVQVTELLKKIEQLIEDNGGQHYSNETSPKKKQEEIRHDNSQEDIEKFLHEQKRETDELLTLMMSLEMSEMAQRLSQVRAMAQSNLSKQDLRIVLLGFLRAGKSATGNTILGKNVFRESLMKTTRRCEKQEAMVHDRNISMIDTPGLLDPFLFRHIQDHNESDIDKSLEMSAPGPHVFLLVIGMEGLARVENNPVKWFQENLEKDALNHTIVLVTHADLLDALIDEPLNEYIQKIKDLKSLIDSCGGRYHSFNNKDRNNRGQVKQLLEKIDEMVQGNGGRHYTKQNIFKRETGGCEIQ